MSDPQRHKLEVEWEMGVFPCFLALLLAIAIGHVGDRIGSAARDLSRALCLQKLSARECKSEFP